MPLVQGCVNTEIKRQILSALDEGCKLDTTGSNLCNTFRNEFASMPSCGECENAGVQERPRRTKIHRLSDYQRHMSVCASEHPMLECVEMWKRGDKQDARYTGSGFTQPKE